MTNKITVRKSRANAENLVFMGFEVDEHGFMTQVVSWKKHAKGADEGLKLIKDKKMKGQFVDGEFQFHPDGLELDVQ